MKFPWDEYIIPTEWKNKIHVPNDQPGKKRGVFFEEFSWMRFLWNDDGKKKTTCFISADGHKNLVPSGNLLRLAIENGPVEIVSLVSFPNKHGDLSSSFC